MNPGGTATYFSPEKYYDTTTGNSSEDIWACAIMIMVLIGDFYLINSIALNRNRHGKKRSTAFFPDGKETKPEMTQHLIQERLNKLSKFKTKELKEKNRSYFELLSNMLKINPEERKDADYLYHELLRLKKEEGKGGTGEGLECPPSPDCVDLYGESGTVIVI